MRCQWDSSESEQESVALNWRHGWAKTSFTAALSRLRLLQAIMAHTTHHVVGLGNGEWRIKLAIDSVVVGRHGVLLVSRSASWSRSPWFDSGFWPSYVEFACSALACMGFLQVLWVPPTFPKNAWYVNWTLGSDPKYDFECEWMFVDVYLAFCPMTAGTSSSDNGWMDLSVHEN